MPVIDLIDCDPDELFRTAKLDDLAETLETLEYWTDRQAQVVDFIYQHRMVQMIQEKASEEKLEQLMDHIDQVLHPSRRKNLDQLKRPYADYFQVYFEILANQLEVRQSKVPEIILERKHVTSIFLEVLETGRIPRQQILQQLQIQENNLTRILKLMEENDLIHLQQEGREKWIVLGDNAERVAKAKGFRFPQIENTETGNDANQSARRGIIFLVKAA